jgi:hypothetical protein
MWAMMGVGMRPRESMLTELQDNEITLHPADSPYPVKLGLILVALFSGIWIPVT